MKRTLALALCALWSCSKADVTPPAPDGGTTCTADAPCVLTPGAPITAAIDTIAQVDHYTVEVPQTFAGKRALLRLALSNAAPVSPVRLVFLLESTDGQAVLGSRGPVKGAGAQALGATFLMPGPGVYPLLVRDATNANADKNNPYTLAAALLEDPDTAEPDDTPPHARVNQPAPANATEPEAKTGIIASAGDIDLLAFELTSDELVRWKVTQSASATQLQLRARILKRSDSAPDDLAAAVPVAEVDADKPGAAVNADVLRFLAAGKYLVALDDHAGTESDSATTWTCSLQLQVDPDPNEQVSRNDSAQTATQLGVGQSKQGAIGSQGDVDWYQIDLPSASTPKLLEVRMDPGGAAADLEFDWAVGDVLAAPSGPCDATCGPFAFCSASQCAYKMHALHHFAKAEFTAQVVRLRHFGAARSVRMVVSDQGSDEWSSKPYTVSAALLDDPDPQELNDTLDTATPVAPAVAGDGSASFAGTGMISWWEFIDGLTTPQQAADLDVYELAMPPRDPAPLCPDLPDDAGPQPDAGPCSPDDGGPTVYLPRPDYGMVAHWRGPSDGVYRLGLQGVGGVPDGGTACLFSFDEKFAHGENDGGFVLGNAPTDPCFCLSSAQAEQDKLWLRIEAAHRPTPPDQNKVTSAPYTFSLDLVPGPAGLQATCDGGCTPITRTSTCPGN